MEEFNLTDKYIEELEEKEENMKLFKDSNLKQILKTGFKYDEERKIYLFNDIIDEEIKDKLFHLGFEINNYYYEWLAIFFSDVYNLIDEDEKLDYIDIDSLYDDILESLDADSYTSDLTAWLDDRNSNVYYLTDVLEEYGPIDDGFKLLSLAQIRAKEEVCQIGKGLIEFLIERELN